MDPLKPAQPSYIPGIAQTEDSPDHDAYGSVSLKQALEQIDFLQYLQEQPSGSSVGKSSGEIAKNEGAIQGQLLNIQTILYPIVTGSKASGDDFSLNEHNFVGSEDGTLVFSEQSDPNTLKIIDSAFFHDLNRVRRTAMRELADDSPFYIVRLENNNVASAGRNPNIPSTVEG